MTATHEAYVSQVPEAVTFTPTQTNAFANSVHRLCTGSLVPILKSLVEAPACFQENFAEVLSDLTTSSSVLEQLTFSTDKYQSTATDVEGDQLFAQLFDAAERIYATAWIRLHAEPWQTASTLWRRLYGLSACILSIAYAWLCFLTLIQGFRSFPLPLSWSIRFHEHLADDTNPDEEKKKAEHSFVDDALRTLRAAFFYGDMGLIIGGYHAEPFDLQDVCVFPLNPDAVGLSSVQIVHLLNTICGVLQSLFCHNQIISPDASSKQRPLLFQLEYFYKLVSADYSPPISNKKINPDTDATQYSYNECVFLVHPTTQAWTIASPLRQNAMLPQISVALAGSHSLLDLLQLYIYQKKPVLLRQGASHWPGLASWRDIPSRLMQCGPLRLIPVEIGSSYNQQQWSQRVITIKEYLQRYLTEQAHDIGYIAQHAMLEHMPELQNELLTPDIVAAVTDITETVRLLWIGPAGTVSPYHTDLRDNVYTQISGFKYVQLVPATVDSSAMYPYREMLKNTSSITPADVFKYPVDCNRYSQFPKEYCQECIVGPGDQVYIPQGWWHFVKALTPSVSLSTWFIPDDNSSL